MARKWHEVNRPGYVDEYVRGYAEALREPTVDES
jgi:hypothetical protein